MRLLAVLIALSIFSGNSTYAQDTKVTIAELLEQGYNIVSSSSTGTFTHSLIFVKEKNAYYCEFSTISGEIDQCMPLHELRTYGG
jgi:hypothetical protein